MLGSGGHARPRKGGCEGPWLVTVGFQGSTRPEAATRGAGMTVAGTPATNAPPHAHSTSSAAPAVAGSEPGTELPSSPAKL